MQKLSFQDFDECKVNVYDGFAEVIRSKTLKAKEQVLEIECRISLDIDSVWALSDSKNFCVKVEVCRPDAKIDTTEYPCSKMTRQLAEVQRKISEIDQDIKNLEQDLQSHFNYFQEAGKNNNSSESKESFSERLLYYSEKRSSINRIITSRIFEKKDVMKLEALYKDGLHEECAIHSQHADENNAEKFKLQQFLIKIQIQQVSEHNQESFKLCFGYSVKNVQWIPNYVIRADEIVNMIYFADIKQSSGDSWENAEVRVIKKPRKAVITKIPEFKNSWFVSSEPEPRAEPLLKMCRATAYCTTENAVYNEDLASASYVISEKVTVSSDCQWHKFSLAKVEIQPKYLYSTCPKLSTDVYLSALLRNTSGMMLLCGECKVFQNNVFLTKSLVPEVGKDCEFSFPLGVESLVEVEYKPLEIYNQVSGMVFSKYERTLSRTIIITNKKSQKVKILVTDQVPKSKESSVAVSIVGNLEKRQTRKDNHSVAKEIEEKKLPFYHEDCGTVDYMEVLESGGTKEIKTTFTVKSEDKCVHGLE